MAGILIVDDMPVIRSALVRILEQYDGNLTPVLQATNGEEAVQTAVQYRPDVILMDIKMPGLTGLQATAVIRKEHPTAKIVMLTAFNEFSYVQKALKLGARDYLLKPVRPKKLQALLKEIEQEIHNERRDLMTVEIVKDSLQKTMPVIETNLVENLIRGTQPEGATVEESLAYLGKRLNKPVVLVGKIDGFDDFIEGKTPQALQQVYISLVDLIRNLLPEPLHALVGYSNPGRIVAIISTNKPLSTIDEIRDLCDQIRHEVASQMSFTMTIGIGNAYDSLESVTISYAEANLARRFQTRQAKNHVIHIKDVQEKPIASGDSLTYRVQREQALVWAVQRNQKQKATELMNEIVDYLAQQYQHNPEAMKNHCAELVTLTSWGAMIAGADSSKTLAVLHRQVRAMTSWKSVSEVRSWALNSLAEMLAIVASLSKQRDVVQEAVDYIQGNYFRSDISLKEVATAVNISQSHLGSLLKTKLGMSYVKYLTSLRLEHAKTLLRATDRSVAHIAETVGYPNVTNFYRHFQKQEGITPAVFRQEI